MARLDAHFKGLGIPYKQISFPDYQNPSSALVKLYLEGALGDQPGDVNAFAASSFYAVDRYASYKQFWQEEYRRGDLILAARYTTSNAIHQMGKLPREEWDGYLAWLAEYEYDRLGLPRPDCVIFLDMPQQVAAALVTARYGGDQDRKDIHERNAAYLTACREAALFAARAWDWRVIDCARENGPRPVEEITADILQVIKEETGV